MSSVIEIQHGRYFIQARKILDDITLSFDQGQIISLLGPNGSGKTTLLKVLLGLLHPQHGDIRYHDVPIATLGCRQLAKYVAYVPQMHREAFAYSVEEVVLMGRQPHKDFFSQYTQEDRQIALGALDRLNIGHLRKRSYTEISGGERQLTLIARALAQGADVFIMDEPVNGLDYGNQMRLLRDIHVLARDGYTFIMTTHFPDHAMMVSDRVVMLKDGKVIADGTPRETITPETLFQLYRIQVDCIPSKGNPVYVPVWAM
ncbi:ABC transporter ATP-binding protein [Desulfogranum japonicum]|uniref:ABC transporter ATP-binding protein n=1 Tax=Desulfogranum japonicum TaxID=231447 RepID=UPI0003FA2867|nr:ABC transporter ATP-binding protein [Desulfogranum japonicum]